MSGRRKRIAVVGGGWAGLAAAVEATRRGHRVELFEMAHHLGGRARQLGSPAERARSAVTWRIRNAIRKIASVHPRLGKHLENSVRTGTFCVYEPETPTEWAL